MGYDTNFEGQFNLDKALTVKQYTTLLDFSRDDHRKEYDAPSYFCDWEPTDDGMGIQYNGSEKFYSYVEWMQYLIEHFLKPWGITVNGEVRYQGHDVGDSGTILVRDNVVTVEKS